MKEYTKELMEFVLSLRYEDLPPEAVELAKRHFLDCVGSALAEAAHPRSGILRRYFDAIGAQGDCRILGYGRRVSVENAAFANGILAHTICFDDSGPSHPSVTVVPGLLALGEKYGFSGKEILAAQVMGYEVFQRLNAVTEEAWEMRKRGWHPTGFFGAVAGAAQTSKLLGLDVETAQRALGIAATLGGGLSQNIGNMGMGLHAGNASRNGVTAALLSRGCGPCLCGSADGQAHLPLPHSQDGSGGPLQPLLRHCGGPSGRRTDPGAVYGPAGAQRRLCRHDGADRGCAGGGRRPAERGDRAAGRFPAGKADSLFQGTSPPRHLEEAQDLRKVMDLLVAAP